MLNRANLKIVTLSALGCASLVWLAGHILYSKASIQELNALHQYDGLHQQHQTNVVAVERKRLKSLALSGITNRGSTIADRAFYNRTLSFASQQEMDEVNEEEVFIKQAEALTDVRCANQFRFTLAALGLLGFSAFCGLVIFVTAPNRQPHP